MYRLRIETEDQLLYRKKMPVPVTDMSKYPTPQWVQQLPRSTSPLDYKWTIAEEEDEDE